MKNIKNMLLYTLIISCLLNIAGYAKDIEKLFSVKEEITIDLILGECKLLNSEDSNIHVTVSYTYDDERYKAIMQEKSKRLVLREKFFGEGSDGESSWIIKVPRGVEISFESATGHLHSSGLLEVELEASSGTGRMLLEKSDGQFEMNSGTGSIRVTDSQGEFELNSGTGDVSVKRCKGEFDVNSGTGDAYGEHITILKQAEFNSGTGEAEVVAPRGEDFDLSINSGTDDAVLNMNEQPLVGYFEFTAHSRRGDIDCPVEFDEETSYENGNGTYNKKSFSREQESPRYYISTGTGTAELIP